MKPQHLGPHPLFMQLFKAFLIGHYFHLAHTQTTGISLLFFYLCSQSGSEIHAKGDPLPTISFYSLGDFLGFWFVKIKSFAQ